MSTENTSYEAHFLEETRAKVKSVLADPQTSALEKKAMFFYLSELSHVHPVADKDKFRPYCMGIGGSGDEQISALYVVRDLKTHEPLTDSKGELIKIRCYFTDLTRYFHTITSQQAETLFKRDGVFAVNEADQKYGAKDPYEYIWKKLQKEWQSGQD